MFSNALATSLAAMLQCWDACQMMKSQLGLWYFISPWQHYVNGLVVIEYHYPYMPVQYHPKSQDTPQWQKVEYSSGAGTKRNTTNGPAWANYEVYFVNTIDVKY